MQIAREGKWPRNARLHLAGSLLILLSALISVEWGFALQRGSPYLMSDFKGVFYGTRCLLQGHDPFKEGAVLNVYQEEQGSDLLSHNEIRQILTRYVNLPATFIIVAPFTMMAWSKAQALWIALNIGSLAVGGYLIWGLASRIAPKISLALICFLLSNCEILVTRGSSAGIVVGLCVLAVWCFVTGRFLSVGLVCFAISLTIKPHDGGLILLYFLVAGAAYQKLAVKTLATTVASGLPAVAWVSIVAPHWLRELRSNLASMSMSGGLNDPGPGSITSRTPGVIIDLQADISVFKNDPQFYNLLTYAICGTLLLVWALATLRSRSSPQKVWFALAAVVPLTMLISYHRPYDAKLLLLAIPSCAMLWARGGVIGALAFVVNSLAVIFTSDFPLTFLLMFTRGMHFETASPIGKIEMVLLTQPAPLALFAMCVFHLWMYLRESGAASEISGATALAAH